MRGKLAGENTAWLDMGNIPAYAGKTLDRQRKVLLMREHPRVCGENLDGLAQGIKALGTSPRMRGKRWKGDSRPLVLRNIPAYAGKTDFPGGSHRPKQEHPRVCGENGCSGREIGYE